MFTIYETPSFKADANRLWSEEERGEFFHWIANNPEAGNIVRVVVAAAWCVGLAAGPAKAAALEPSTFCRALQGKFVCLFFIQNLKKHLFQVIY